MQIQEVVNNRWAQLAAASVVAFAGGAGVGYIFGKKRTQKLVDASIPGQLSIDQYIAYMERVRELKKLEVIESDDSELLSQTDAEVEEFMLAEGEHLAGDLVDQDEPEDSDEEGADSEEASGEAKSPIELALEEKEELTNVIELNPEVSEDEDADDVDAAIAEARSSHPTANVFDNPSEDWNYQEELAARTSEAPYILHQDEFYADERGYTQTTLTYYAGDQILADEQDKPIYNYGAIVGELKFGHGTNDPNVVYIRNEALEAEYEVLLDNTSFEVSVLGFDADSTEVEHSGLHKFRADD
jgi:hypothetical protein